MRAVVSRRLHGVEVALHAAQPQGRRDEDGDDDAGPPHRAVLLALEGMADGDVALRGEAQHQQRAQVLGGQEEDGEELADDGRVEGVVFPHHVQLQQHVQREEDEVVEGEGGQVAARRVAHALLDPDDEGEDVAREADAVDEDGDVLVHADHLRLDVVEEVDAVAEDVHVPAVCLDAGTVLRVSGAAAAVVAAAAAAHGSVDVAGGGGHDSQQTENNGTSGWQDLRRHPRSHPGNTAQTMR